MKALKLTKKGPEMSLGSMQVKAPLKGHEEGYSTHAIWTPKMEKRALNRAYAGPKTHQKWPETWLGSMQIKAPLLGQIC